MPSHVGFDDFRRTLASYLDEVASSGKPLTVTRRAGDSVVVVAEQEWRSMEETLYLMSNPRNAQHLVEAIAELDTGRGIERQIVEKRD